MVQASRWHRLALCALVAGVLYIPGLGRPALWEPDEGRYAEIAREMVQSADYVTPRDDWVRYFEKPPLMYWATAVAIKTLGESEFAVRIPAALFSVGEVVVTCALAETMLGASAGLLAAMVLAMSPLVWGFARFLTLDPALAFFVTAALGAFYAAARAPDFRNPAARRWLIASAAMVAMGTLTKGPVALVICGSVAFIDLLVERRLRDLARIPWLACILVYATIVAPWFVLVARRNPEFLHYFFIHEHLHRYLGNTEHGWGPWFLIAVAAGGTWPWLYFIPLGVAELRRNRGEGRADHRGALAFLSIWFLFVLVFFSIPRSKLGSYILPGIPPLAIIAGYGLKRLGELDRGRIRRLLGGFAILNLVAAGACLIVLPIAGADLGRALVVDGIIAAGCLAIGAVASFAIGARGGRIQAAIAAIAISVCGATLAGIKGQVDAAPIISYRRLALAIAPYLRPGCVLASYGHLEQSMPFYTHRRETMVNYLGELGTGRDTPDGAKSFLEKAQLPALWGSSCVVLVANQRDQTELAQTLRPYPLVIACEGKKVALYNGRAGGRPPSFDCFGPIGSP